MNTKCSVSTNISRKKWRPIMQELHSTFPWSAQYFNLQSTVSQKVTGIAIIPHGAKWSWSYVPFVIRPFLVRDFSKQIIGPFSKCFGSQLQHLNALLSWFFPLSTQFLINERRAVIPYHLLWPVIRAENKSTKEPRWGIIDLFTVSLWPIVSKTYTVLTPML